MRRLLLSLIFVLALPLVALADPCSDPGVHRVSVPITIATATTTQLLAPVTNASYYLCGFSLSLTGTTPTFGFEYGTGSSCGTGTTAITGVYTAGPVYYPGYFGETPLSDAVCAVTTGTVAANGHLTYVLIAR